MRYYQETDGEPLDKFEKRGIVQAYSTGSYNKFDDDEQWIRITQGCPNGCQFCYEPKEKVLFGIPEIVRNDVHIMDMNLLSFPEALDIIRELGYKMVNDKNVGYTLVCGLDHRFLTKEIAFALHDANFYSIRIAWDFHYTDQKKIKNAISTLKSVGYKPRDIMIFMICNWKIPFDECVKKLNLCKYWNVQVADCYFDGQTSPNIEPIGWTTEEIKGFRHNVRKHNQITNFQIDPELPDMEKFSFDNMELGK